MQSYIIGPQWTLGEWFFLIWAAGITLIVCQMFIWWLAVQFFDPEDFEDIPAVSSSTVDAVAGAADFLARNG